MVCPNSYRRQKRTNTAVHLGFFILLLSVTGAVAATDGAQSYPDGHGGEVRFPQGGVSFADAVEHYASGDPSPKAGASDPEAALGIPDTVGTESGYVSLGCAGELVLEFNDNALIDVPGPDLYVFEIGPDVEPTGLSVSNDGDNWIRVGSISGGKAEIDLAPYVSAGTEFRYVRLVDLKSACSSAATPGADIDAVGAIGSAQRIALDSAVLFDSGRYELQPEASTAIDKALMDIDNREVTSVVVAGHTDSVGSADKNKQLSENRARAVAEYLVDQAGFSGQRVSREAYGESRQIAGNDTTAGRAKNRRVELTVRTRRSADAENTESAERVEILGLWDAEEQGVMELRRTDAGIEGEYTLDNGRVRGDFTSDTVFEGYWIEDDSNRTCKTAKADSEHWGPLRIEFESAERDTYTGQWRYCGEDEWHGKWPSGKRLL